LCSTGKTTAEMASQQCSMCSNPSTVRCKACRCSAYCSTECQKTDWPTHKLLCKHLPEFATPPNASARRGILFPIDAATPRFVWVDNEWIPPRDPDDEGDRGFEKIKHMRAYIGDSYSDSVGVWGNVIHSRERQDQLHILMKETALIDGSMPNSSIARVLRASGAPTTFYSWCGGMLAMKLPTLGIDPGRYVHMDTVDFRDVVDTFRSYGSSVRIGEMERNVKHKGPVSPYDEVLDNERSTQYGMRNI
jgi:hypothetical protein